MNVNRFGHCGKRYWKYLDLESVRQSMPHSDDIPMPLQCLNFLSHMPKTVMNCAAQATEEGTNEKKARQDLNSFPKDGKIESLHLRCSFESSSVTRIS